MSEELLPCPFCGSAPQLTGVYFECDDDMARMKVMCASCDVSQQSSMIGRDYRSVSKEQSKQHLTHHVVKEWNTRIPSPDAGTGTPDDESFKPFFDRAEQSSTYWRELYTLTQEALAVAMADNAALRADKERVDWLETQDCWIGICGDYNAEPIHSAGGCYVAKVRDICDAARAAKSEGGEDRKPA